MGREIERKFLVNNDGWRTRAGKGTHYRQGYICVDPERSARVRVSADKAFLTIKGISKGAERDEFEYSIPKHDADEILDRICLQPLLDKTRYVIAASPFKWEIDEFSGDNAGLIVAEIEIDRDDADFDKPDWLGEEVTCDPRYYNANLVRNPYSSWREK